MSVVTSALCFGIVVAHRGIVNAYSEKSEFEGLKRDFEKSPEAGFDYLRHLKSDDARGPE
jgi:hypothetical protein